MLTKILFTLAVIVVVAMVFRTKTTPNAAPVNPAIEHNSSLSVRVVTYGILGVLLLISAVVFIFKYQSDNTIINIRVISEDGTSTIYQAHQKTIKGRQFTTLDNRQVTLGESDRIEMDEQ